MESRVCSLTGKILYFVPNHGLATVIRLVSIKIKRLAARGELATTPQSNRKQIAKCNALHKENEICFFSLPSKQSSISGVAT